MSCIGDIRHQSQHGAGQFFQPQAFIFGRIGEQGRIVTGIYVGDMTGRQLQLSKPNGDKQTLLIVPYKSIVCLPYCLCQRHFVCILPQQCLSNHHKEGSRYSFAGDIGYCDYQMVAAQQEGVVGRPNMSGKAKLLTKVTKIMPLAALPEVPFNSRLIVCLPDKTYAPKALMRNLMPVMATSTPVPFIRRADFRTAASRTPSWAPIAAPIPRARPVNHIM